MGCTNESTITEQDMQRRRALKRDNSENYISVDNRQPINVDNNNNNGIIKNGEGEDEENEESEYSQMNFEFVPYLQSKNDPSFNFPLTKEEKYVGKGIFKMRCYVSNIPLEEIKKKREAFWGTRVEGNEQTWSFLKDVCSLPPEEQGEVEAMLQAYDLKTFRRCINVTYDALGGLYEIPNYCIHEPSEYDLPESHIKKPDEKVIKFIVRKGVKEIKVKISNYSLVSDIKEFVAEKMKKNKDNLRLFFYGREMKNDKEIWNYNLDDDCVVSLMIIE